MPSLLRTIHLIVVSAFLFTATSIYAAECSSSGVNLVEKATANATSAGPLNTAGGILPGIQLTLNSDGGSSAIKTTLYQSPCISNEKLVSHPITLTLSVPTGGASDITKGINNGSLTTDQSYVQLEVTSVTAYPFGGGGFRKEFSDLSNFCTALTKNPEYDKHKMDWQIKIIKTAISKDPTSKNKLQPGELERALMGVDPALVDNVTRNIVHEYNTNVKDASDKLEASYHCSQAVKDYGDYRQLRVFNRTVAMVYRTYGLNARYGYKQFGNVVISSTPTSGMINQNKYPWSVGAFLGFTVGASAPNPYFVTLSAKYEEKYDPGDQVTLCPATSTGSGDVICNSGSGPAVKNQGGVYSASIRRELNIGRVAGWIATATYDQKKKKSGLEVPFYFTGDDGKANYGVSIGWREQSNPKFYVAIFVGSNFNLFGGN